VSSYRKFLYTLQSGSAKVLTSPPGEGWHLDYVTLPPYEKNHTKSFWGRLQKL